MVVHSDIPSLPPHREEQVLQERAEAWSKVEQMAQENPVVSYWLWRVTLS